MTLSVLDRLETLHQTYIVAVNEAVADGRSEAVQRLAADYDLSSAQLLAEELHLELPAEDTAALVGPRRSRLQRLVRGQRAA